MHVGVHVQNSDTHIPLTKQCKLVSAFEIFSTPTTASTQILKFSRAGDTVPGTWNHVPGHAPVTRPCWGPITRPIMKLCMGWEITQCWTFAFLYAWDEKALGCKKKQVEQPFSRAEEQRKLRKSRAKWFCRNVNYLWEPAINFNTEVWGVQKVSRGEKKLEPRAALRKVRI